MYASVRIFTETGLDLRANQSVAHIQPSRPNNINCIDNKKKKKKKQPSRAKLFPALSLAGEFFGFHHFQRENYQQYSSNEGRMSAL